MTKEELLQEVNALVEKFHKDIGFVAPELQSFRWELFRKELNNLIAFNFNSVVRDIMDLDEIQ